MGLMYVTPAGDLITLPNIVFATAFFFLANRLWTWYRLSHVPGPLRNSISSLFLLRTQLGGNVHADLNNLIRKHGSSLVRIGPNAVLTNDAKLVQRMEAPRSPYVKSSWYGTFRFMKGTDHSFSLNDERRHSALRTKIGPGYSSTHLAEQSIDRQLIRFIDLIERKFLSNEDGHLYKPVDFALITHLYSMDVVGDWTFGKPFGFLEDGIDIYGYIAWNEGFFPFVTMASTFPFLSKVLQTWPFSELLPKPTDSIGLGRFMKVAQDAIDERLSLDIDLRNDLLGIFLQHGLSKDQAVNEALVQVVAGTDSVAVAVRMALLYILSNPRVYSILMSELDAASVTRPIIRDVEARQMPYFQAVIRESLRIFPTVTPLMFKSVPAGGDMVAGYELPAGTQVGVDQFGILRSKEYWGQDADLFIPERWLNVDAKRVEAMAEYLEASFGYGKYKCLGRSIAFVEINKTLFELLRRFKFTVVDPAAPLKMFSASFWMMKDFWMIITPREGESPMPLGLQ
ncbi:putative Pisatin demethylase [Seiridium unicorne]|uniref:Pisatin demethylase n=1 Tax=Seiridium unicorne TaxID=138068 RepID=A0ABR2UFL0_9PEZI